jgi:hypothetical protein
MAKSKKQASAPESLMLMCFGQSNADVHDAGPRLAPEAENVFPVVMPNDGKWVRGYMGGPRVHPITGFEPISGAPDAIQSILVPAAARLVHDMGDAAPTRVIVRSEARGGRPFLGFENNGALVDGIFRNPDGQHTIIFENLITTLRDSITVAADEGTPISLINMVWLHGEADRAMAREVYTALHLEFIAEVEALIADTGVAIHWTLIQPSGTGPTGGGNFWPNRLALFDVAAAQDNCDVALTAYAYGQFDGSHYSADGKLRMGENLGRIIAKRLMQKTHQLPQPVAAQMDGHDVTLTIAADDPLVLDTDTNPLPDGTVMGFHTADRNRAELQEVTVVGDTQVRLRFDRDPDPATLKIHYAYKHNRRGDDITLVLCPAGRGCLRTSAAIPSVLRPDTVLHDWVAGFSITLADMTA